MPIDQRRINGPEITIPYHIYVDLSSKKTETRKNLLLKREDGRKHSEIRKMCKVILLLNPTNIIFSIVNNNNLPLTF